MDEKIDLGTYNELYVAKAKMARRKFLTQSAAGLGGIALADLFSDARFTKNSVTGKAKKIIYLFMAGGPSQFETFDYKPVLKKLAGQNLPESIRKGQRLTGMSANQANLPLAPSKYSFSQVGNSGQWISSLLPHTGRIADELCIIKSMYTEAINHDPAITFCQTGHQLPGRPSIGSWISYGLGSLNQNLPHFIVLVSKNAPRDQPLYARLWGNGFLSSDHQGVPFRAGADPVLFLKNPPGYTMEDRKDFLETARQLNSIQQEIWADKEMDARINQYEMAFRMQTSIPDAVDLSKEPDATFELYGKESREPGTFAANCLLARKLIEKDVRFVQLYHQGWDHHGGLPKGIEQQCKATDQACAALIQDLKQRGLLEDTVVIWGGEFGRTAYSQGKLPENDYGRDHHPRCFTMWMAGAGIQAGMSYGQTDDFSYNIDQQPVHIHDLHATLLHIMGLDHEALTFKFQGRRYRLTDVHGRVVHNILT
jgi:hypothetical protein